MERKLVEQGKKTLMVSIPIKWAKSYKLAKGDTISVSIVKDKMIISPREKAQKNAVVIRLNFLSESAIRTVITNAYRCGYDQIKVEMKNEKQKEIVDEIVRKRLFGFDITGSEVKSCVIENIANVEEGNFYAMVDKMFLCIKSLLSEVLKEKGTKNIEEREERIMIYDNICKRMIKKKGVTTEKSELYWVFLTLLLHAQREIYFLIKESKKKEFSKEVKSLIRASQEMFLLIEKAYREKEKELLEEMHLKEKEWVLKKGYKLLEKASGRESIMMYRALASIRLFYQANSPLMGILMLQEEHL